MILPPVERGDVGQVVGLAVDPDPDEPLLPGVLEEVLELALAAADQRRQHLDPGALGPGEDGIGDLGRALPFDRAAVIGAVGDADPGPEQPQVVVDLGDRADSGPGVLGGGLLFDRDGGREPLDGVDVGLLHQPQELPGIRRERLDVPPLPLGVDGVEGEGRLPAAGQAGDDGQPVPGNGNGDVLEIVLAGTADDEELFRHKPRKLDGSSVRYSSRRRSRVLGVRTVSSTMSRLLGHGFERLPLGGGGHPFGRGGHQDHDAERRRRGPEGTASASASATRRAPRPAVSPRSQAQSAASRASTFERPGRRAS